MTTPLARAEQLLRLQQEITADIALGTDPVDVLDALCRGVERQVPGSVALVMRRAGDALRIVAAPCAPTELRAHVDGLVPGPYAGSCGTAAYRREEVLVEDTRTDARWAPVREIAERFDIASCWSVPLISRGDVLLGTFTLSSSTTGAPSEAELLALRTAGNLAAIVLERAEGEERLRSQRELLSSILDATEDPIFAKDVERRYIAVNEADVRGVSDDAADMLGKRDEDLYPAEVAAVTGAWEEEVLRTGRSRVDEIEYDNPAEGRRTFMIRRSPLRDEHGAVRGLVGVARDITELRRAEVALRHAQKMEGLGVLAGGIAHDFNNLLARVLGNADLALSEEPLSPEARASLVEIREAALRAADLTSQMLAYSGRAEPRRREVELSGVVAEVTARVRGTLPDGVELETDLAAGLPTLEADPSQMLLAVENIVSNAVEALDGRNGAVFVSLRHEPGTNVSPHTGPRLVLEVADDGEGMDQETAARIFDPFFTTKFPGRGLGLAAVQGIVRAHGGTVHVTSAPGRGTTLAVHLPLAPAGHAVDDTLPRGTLAPEGSTVLIVDDEPALLLLAANVLERAGLRTLRAADGAEALATLADRGSAIDLLLLDLTMPGMNGATVLRRARQLRPELPVVLTSGYAESDIRREFATEDLDGFVQKPFLPSNLLSTTLGVLGNGSGTEARPTTATART
jgi:PAS domain S-box-containing protein